MCQPLRPSSPLLLLLAPPEKSLRSRYRSASRAACSSSSAPEVAAPRAPPRPGLDSSSRASKRSNCQVGIAECRQQVISCLEDCRHTACVVPQRARRAVHFQGGRVGCHAAPLGSRLSPIDSCEWLRLVLGLAALPRPHYATALLQELASARRHLINLL